MSKKIATEEEFRSLMEEVDLELRDQKVPITVRQTKAIWFVKRRLGIVGDTCLSDLPAQPRHGATKATILLCAFCTGCGIVMATGSTYLWPDKQ